MVGAYQRMGSTELHWRCQLESRTGSSTDRSTRNQYSKRRALERRGEQRRAEMGDSKGERMYQSLPIAPGST